MVGVYIHFSLSNMSFVLNLMLRDACIRYRFTCIKLSNMRDTRNQSIWQIANSCSLLIFIQIHMVSLTFCNDSLPANSVIVCNWNGIVAANGRTYSGRAHKTGHFKINCTKFGISEALIKVNRFHFFLNVDFSKHGKSIKWIIQLCWAVSKLMYAFRNARVLLFY